MSSILRNLENYLEPSQTCIKPIDSEPAFKEGDIQKAVKISLNDCLACSGCITSAESVLVSMQTTQELFKALEDGKYVVVSVSPQSVASIAAKYSSSFEKAAFGGLSAFLRSVGAERVLDLSVAKEIHLLETWKEFQEKGSLGNTMICSSCPGWICYAEKMQQHLVPFLAATKSPQQIMGSIVKSVYSQQWGIPPDSIFHLTIMPCYDKKLEASRKDFERDSIKDVDCVVSTAEIEAAWLDRNFDMAKTEAVESTQLYYGPSAGGTLEYLVSKILEEHPDATLNRIDKVKDFVEFHILNRDAVLCKLAKVYGFKNIQNYVRKAKSKSCEYAYVEVMACPSACIAGGGQLKIDGLSAKEAIEHATATFASVSTEAESALFNSSVISLHRQLGGMDQLRTQFHTVPKTAFNLNTQW